MSVFIFYEVGITDITPKLEASLSLDLIEYAHTLASCVHLSMQTSGRSAITGRPSPLRCMWPY